MTEYFKFSIQDNCILLNNEIWATCEDKQDARKVAAALRDMIRGGMRLAKENEQLKEEIKGLNDILARYEEKELKERIDDEKNCGHCKHFEIDGMFGLWCEKGHDWTLVEYCSDYEKGL